TLLEFANISEPKSNRSKVMALFNKQTDRTIKDDSTPKPSALPEVERFPATETSAPANSAPTEKPVASMRPASVETSSNSEIGTYLDNGSKISGKLWFEGATRIDGQVDGEITSKESLVIGESAVVTAQIRAKSIIVAGKANGEIIANQRLE